MKFSSDTDVLKLNGSSDTKKDEKPEVINLKEVKEKV